MPAPVIDSVACESEALLATVRVPEDAPLLVGEKTTSKGTVWPIEIVNGKETPEIENCELLVFADDTVTTPPVALMLEGCVVVAPTSTLPKLSAVGAMMSCATVVLVPVPVKGIFRFRPVRNTLPPVSPTDCGEKEKARLTLCPAGRTNGNAGPLAEKPVPTA